MLKHVTFLGSAALAIALSTGVVAQDVTAATVVAKVGATEITMGEIIIARAQLPPQYAQFPNAVLLEGIIDQLIQQQLLADTLDAVPARIDYTLQNERRSLLAAEVISAITQQAVTEDALQAAFDARFADAAGVNEFNASHLLVETEEEARAAKTRIDDGAAFADVARDVSTGPTGPNGGNLGWFEAGAMVPEFETAIMALGVGDVSEPFETQFGWHVATLNEIRVQPLPTLDEMRRELTDVLQEAAVTARLDELTTEQEVVKPAAGDFDPDLIDNLDLLDQ
ncbi:peptidylprolyl isomerase [Yoonia sp.]|uniref:peptidylprolyl isomerase n=1 Tax=Yoonia sp. TaxID=2212373 RepID=UPI0025CC1DDC|nr:peptidylprolyl isomerase [Yoonia sp.]